MWEVIVTYQPSHAYFEHCWTALFEDPHRFSVHWMWQWLSCSHEQEVQEIIVVLIYVYINWSTVLSLHTLEAYLHLFLALALDGGQWAASHLGILFLVERPPAMHWMGGGVGPRTSLVAFEGEKSLLSLLWIKQFLTFPTHSLFLCKFRDIKLKD
jgi:hypothetical protein